MRANNVIHRRPRREFAASTLIGPAKLTFHRRHRRRLHGRYSHEQLAQFVSRAQLKRIQSFLPLCSSVTIKSRRAREKAN